MWTGRLLPQKQCARRNADSVRNPKSNFLTLGKWAIVWAGILSVGAADGKPLRPPLPFAQSTLC